MIAGAVTLVVATTMASGGTLTLGTVGVAADMVGTGLAMIATGEVVNNLTASKSQSQAAPTTATDTQVKNKNPATIRMQVQKNGTGNTLATTRPIVNSQTTGVTKSQASLGLNGLKETLPNQNSGMARSKEYNAASDRMQQRINTVHGIPDGQNVLQENFTYKGTEYRIDLDSFRGQGGNLSTQ